MREKKLFRKFVSLSASSALFLNLLPLSVQTNAADTAIENALAWAVSIANDDSHGYSQQNRQGPDYDCSSLVINSLKHAGINTGGASYTGDMRTELTKHGFTWIPWSQIGNVSNLQRGDILLYRGASSGHTEMYLGNNKNVGAHGTYGHPEKGDQTGKEISVADYWYDKWNGVLRYNYTEPPKKNDDDNEYFRACATSYASIVEALQSIGEESSFAYRKEIAAENEISGYSGTAEQNIQMLDMLKSGTLKRPSGEPAVIIDPPPVVDYGETYFPACSSDFSSIVDAFASFGVDSSMANRKIIAEYNGISNYSGTAEQNIELLNRLKEGKLLNPNGSTSTSVDTSEKYYPACASSYSSIVDALNSIGVDSSKSNRAVIAVVNNISNYSGTAEQNIQMLNMLKSGQLIRTDWSEPPAIENYTVSLDANGGTSPVASMTIASDSSYNGLPVAAREGYSFDGWYTSTAGGVKVDNGSALVYSSDHTLYAHWTANTYTVSFENNDGSGVTLSNEVKYGNSYGALPTPKRMGYTLVGWFTDSAEGTEVNSDSIFNYADNQTLYAHWKANTYKVSLYTESDKLLETVDAVYDDVYGELPVPESENGKFAGWFTDDGIEIKSDTQVHTASDLKLYVKWEQEEKTDAGDINGDENVNLKDVVLLRRYIAGGWGVELDEKTADLNGDGAVNLKDVVLLRRYIAGGWNVKL